MAMRYESFFAKVSDDVMKGEGLCIGDTVVVEESPFQEGDIVAVLTKSGLLFRRIFFEEHNYRFLPSFPGPCTQDKSRINIIGKVIEAHTKF